MVGSKRFSSFVLFLLSVVFVYGQNPVRISDLNPGSGDSEIYEMQVFKDKLYFSGKDGSVGKELWKYNGCEISLAANINKTSSWGGGSHPQWMTVFKGDMYFNANDGIHNDELWKYNPASGASLVKNINSGYHSIPSDLTVYNNVLYFEARDGTHGDELMQYDGSQVSLAADIYSGWQASRVHNLQVYSGDLYFRAKSKNGKGVELWKYDGSQASMVADIYTGSDDSWPDYLTVYNGDLFFQAEDSQHGVELWKYDGSSVSLVADINSNGNGNPAGLTVYNGDLFFSANGGSNGNELWKYDGSAVSLVADINSSGDGSPKAFEVYNGDLYFQAKDGNNGEELWKYDGNTVSLVADINKSGSSTPESLTVYKGALYFEADGGQKGRELWKYSAEWTGNSNSSFTNANNWDGNKPSDTTSVYIPPNQSNIPNISQNKSVENLRVGNNTSKGSIKVQSGNTLTVKGNVINKGKNDFGDGKLQIKGNGCQLIKGSNEIVIDNLAFNNNKGIKLKNSLKVESTLSLTKGVVSIPNSTDSVTLTNSASVSPQGGSSNAYIDGKVSKIGNSAFTFPIGDSSHWARARIETPLNSGDVYTASYHRKKFKNITSFASGSGLNNVSKEEYWIINRFNVNPSSSVKVKLHWEDGSSSGIDNIWALRLVHWNGSKWENKGVNSTSGSVSSGSITVNGIRSFSPFTFGSGTSANNGLPVEMEYFTAENKGESVILNWHTASEQNASHFLIQRSKGGKTFKNIGRRKAQGTTTEPTDYSYPDDNPAKTNYYRLKQVDFDGSYEYSKVISVSSKESTHDGIQLTTRSAKNGIIGKVQVGQKGRYQLKVINSKGQMVQSQAYPLEKGQNTLKVHLNDHSPGIYFLTIRGNGKHAHEKVLVK